MESNRQSAEVITSTRLLEGRRKTHYPISIEFIFELVLSQLGPSVHSISPCVIQAVIRPQSAIDLPDNLSEELRVLALLNLVVRHPQSLQLHRRDAAFFGDEKEARNLRPAGVQRGVGLDVELLVADDWAVPLRFDVVLAVGVDLAVPDNSPRSIIFRFHGERSYLEQKEL